MKTLKLSMGGKVYTSGKITAWHAREAIAVNKQALATSAMQTSVSEASTTEETVVAAQNILDALEELSTRKGNLLCDVFGGKFTLDEIEKNLSDDEIDDAIAMIMNGIAGVITKN